MKLFEIAKSFGYDMASMRSSKPPWPDRIEPESLTPSPRFIRDSTRSPNCAAMLTAEPALQSAQILNQIEIPGGVEQADRKLAEARLSDPKAVVFPKTIVNLIG
jgi:hypothetical protein